MSVLSCDRRGCENIMCDRYSHKYGYLCHECFDELVAKGPNVNIEEFMGSKPPSPLDQPSTYDKWDEEFPNRNS